VPPATRKPTAKTGSFVSTKEITRAAVKQSKVEFHTSVGMITGFVFGGDDYHWRVAVLSTSNKVRTTLVHKGSTAYVVITEATLADEPDPNVIQAITAMGQAYWASLADTSENV
jgi:hypothetical protein